MRTRRKVLIIAVAVTAVLGITIGISLYVFQHSQQDQPVQDNQRKIIGRIACPANVKVTGVRIEISARQHDTYWKPGDNEAYFEYKVAQWPSSYRLHVGCGGTRNKWATHNVSTKLTARLSTYLCGAAPGEYYGSCETAEKK